MKKGREPKKIKLNYLHLSRYPSLVPKIYTIKMMTRLRGRGYEDKIQIPYQITLSAGVGMPYEVVLL